ncbi:MAG: glycine cleavage T C-terminal barrel domain-containing protein [Bowdeniella nasicola]|nr:glycine cleavage T C-terminal barrel domain-containing protein [Bowdeniella nasicola]
MMMQLDELTGAVVDSDGIMWHRGRPAQEYREFVAGRALVPLPDWQLLTICGPDRLTWLHALSSQHLSNLVPGQSSETLLLSPNGHITAALALVDDGEQLSVFVERAIAPEVVNHLEKMRFAARITISASNDHVIALAGSGRDNPPIDPQAIWVDPWPHLPGGARYTPAGVEPAATHIALAAVSPAHWQEYLGAHGETIVGALAFEAVRIAAWRPRYTREVDERTIPPELDWLRTAVHLDKGCYCGQETIARVVNLGKPPRRLVLLHLDGSAEHLPEHGAQVMWKTRQVGTITSAVRHPELGPIALALVKRNLPADAPLLVDEVAAAQEIIVNPSGESDARPASRPGAELRGVRRGLQRPTMR